jgi:hypothetical protein
MGFITGVITGMAIAAAGAAWYMSRSGQSFRDQYRLEDKLGQIGDRVGQSSKDLQQTVNAQISEMRSNGGASGPADPIAGAADQALDEAKATAAEVEAAVGAEADQATKRVRKAVE